MNNRGFRTTKKRRKMLLLYTVFLVLVAIAICLMPFGSALREKTMAVMYVSGVAFWCGLIGTVYMAFKINRYRKCSRRFHDHYGDLRQLGLIHFFQNRNALIADVIMLASIAGFIIARIWISEIVVSFWFLAIFVFSFGMHCMLNGINYKYIKDEDRRGDQNE